MEKNEYNFFNEKNVSGFSFALMIVLYVFISFFGQLLAGAIFGYGTAYLAVCSTFSSISMAVVLACLLIKRKEKLITGLSVKPFKIKYLFCALTISFGMLFGLGFLNDAVVKLFQKAGLNVSGISIPLDSTLQFVIFSTVLAILPAVFEECFFRSFMLGNLKNTRTLIAILSVSICFALYHKSVAQFFYQVIYGAVLCLLFKRANSVIPCMIAHFLNNFVVLCFEYFKVSVNLYNPILIVSGLAVLILTVLFLILEQYREDKGKKKDGLIRNFWLPSALFGAIICVALLVGNLFGG